MPQNMSWVVRGNAHQSNRFCSVRWSIQVEHEDVRELLRLAMAGPSSRASTMRSRPMCRPPESEATLSVCREFFEARLDRLMASPACLASP